jgi:hypothetical protein
LFYLEKGFAMSSFTKSLALEQLHPVSSGLWETTRSFIYFEGYEGSDKPHFVPENFITDLASMPRFLWSIVGHPAGPYAQAAVLHDKLYRDGKLTRKQADKIFLEAMEVLKIPKWKRRVLYWGVRAGGWRAWNNHRKNGKKKTLAQASPKRVYVFAGDIRQARNYFLSRQEKYARHRVIDRPQDLRGAGHGHTLVLVGTYYGRLDFGEVRDMAAAQEWDILVAVEQ